VKNEVSVLKQILSFHIIILVKIVHVKFNTKSEYTLTLRCWYSGKDICWRVRGRIPGNSKGCLLVKNFQTTSGVPPTLLFSRQDWSVNSATPPTRAEVKNERSYTSSPLISCHGVGRVKTFLHCDALLPMVIRRNFFKHFEGGERTHVPCTGTQNSISGCASPQEYARRSYFVLSDGRASQQQQDKQCAYIVTLRRVHESLLV
jgi:hypothetical protein